ncbi:MAG: cyclodeaminase/cyclohydrolase family protein [Lachnospiraceae bacterium]|nr:cyclodeaminase/cyclohydrolase family protein [Lachnospiraceae bacterium]MBQ1641211.1 cyclodeaminase/cyclohydrolase family protein [Lachnospiraceae bacterium]MBQ1721165.1 cyclodeaminase/cyclohydrolase family protein [Lachnospiraceae bacterium]MBQ2467528.1 cyclodeaminase/cyclohydrolase family protein [Lachnospiraceae bacterium]MBQ2504378.1 cyclodeaminase/cyclohydrolase family protein [Lachnospiraceae bacterium]
MGIMAESTIYQFINELSSDAPIPGGGGASGLVAACGMALGNMVLSLTTGKKKFEQYQDEIDDLIEKGNNLTDALLRGMDADAAAFIPLTMAYRMPKDTEEEQAKRDAVMEEALVTASEAPLHMMANIMEAMHLIHRIAEIGSRMAISDAGVGIQCCMAAMHGASLNVFINTKSMKNREVAEDMNRRADALIKEAELVGNRTYELVLQAVR